LLSDTFHAASRSECVRFGSYPILDINLPESNPIEILIEDPWFLVVNKPVDLLTQAIDTIPSLQSRLIEQLSSPKLPKPFVGIPHRLDRMTSGTVVVARNQRSLRRLCDQFAARTIGKEYLVWVSGQPAMQGTWEDYLRKIPDQPKAELCDPDQEHAKPANLDFQVLTTRTRSCDQVESLLKIRLGTGRMHQIRLQCASRGFPILGDRLYGSLSLWQQVGPSTSGPFREPPMALHAFRLTFHHPKTAECIIGQTNPPSDFPWGDPRNWLAQDSE
jgi:RluA family pseudouridine synthase